MKQDDRYTLVTEELGAHRLSILNTIHKLYTEWSSSLSSSSRCITLGILAVAYYKGSIR
ncbi:MAG: hypothetical protein V7L22_05380 [Nostoc sp.]|uniref:hypothetical protein n=1 Tax=Nostoc sp. TaxID=1180 RepID=UPI002FFAC7BF